RHDVLVVLDLDRLGRLVHDLVALIDGLEKRGISFRALNSPMWDLLRPVSLRAGGHARPRPRHRDHARRRAGGRGTRVRADRAGDARLPGPRPLPSARLRRRRGDRGLPARAPVPDDAEAPAMTACARSDRRQLSWPPTLNRT